MFPTNYNMLKHQKSIAQLIEMEDINLNEKTIHVFTNYEPFFLTLKHYLKLMQLEMTVK